MTLDRSWKIALGLYGLIIVLGCGSLGDGDFTYGEYSSRPDAVEGENGFVETSDETLSTFATDVDQASYTIGRRSLRQGELPPPESVRPEEWVNYFDYDYTEPDDYPFSIDMEAAPSPFGEADTKLLRIGLRGRDVVLADMRPTRLTFVVDHSGSMIDQDDAVVAAIRSVRRNLRPDDAIAIVVFEGEQLDLLPPTRIRDRATIDSALARLEEGDFSLGGITDGEAGLQRGYELAGQMFEDGGNNRVMLMSDGGFNDGVTDDDLIELIRTHRDERISLTTIGFAGSTYDDYNLEGLAQVAHGNYYYVDSPEEARRIFEEQLQRIVEVIAADVKVQVAFEERSVKRYRLIGYDDRRLPNEDFENDGADAGEVGAGHTVTALYEVELQPDAGDRDVLAEVRLNYKRELGDESESFSRAIKVANVLDDFARASDDFRFATAVAEFAEILRQSQHSEGRRFDEVRTIASSANPDGDAYRSELVELVDVAAAL